jgi:hypothetical protein
MSTNGRPATLWCGTIAAWCIAATWFDAENEARVMWRTTVSGNPGAAYVGERKSWIAAA